VKKIELKKSEQLVQDSVAAYYEDVRYALPAARQYYQWFFKKLFSLAQPYGQILDNGCGNGILGEFWEGDIVGVDLSAEMASRARKRLKEVRVGDSQYLPFADKSFDTVISLSLLHHLPDPMKGLDEIVRVLRPGGTAIFEEVVKTSLSAVPRFFLNRFSSHFSHEHKNFRKFELLSLIGDRLKIQEVRHYGYLAYALLGFPDIINFQRYLPLKSVTIPLLLSLDDMMEKVPLLKTQSWNIIIIASKPK